MKKNIRYLWIYTGILFTVALFLIIFAYLTQSNIISETKEIQESNNTLMQKSLTQLTEENTQLKNEVAQKDALIEEQRQIIEKYTEKETETLLSKETDEKFVMAYEKYVAGSKTEAKNMISTYTRENLSNIQQKIYDIIIGNWFLLKKGVK